jgi:hypothetical protein
MAAEVEGAQAPGAGEIEPVDLYGAGHERAERGAQRREAEEPSHRRLLGNSPEPNRNPDGGLRHVSAAAS